MTIQPLEVIVCAVRGGPKSRETVTRAIEMALERGAKLTFFHVIDAEFMETCHDWSTQVLCTMNWLK